MQPTEQVNPQQLTQQAQAWREAMLAFARQLVQTPSPSGQEGAIAELVVAKMRELGYDEAFLDEAGNVVGRIKGRGTGPSVLFASHLDDVGVGDVSLWKHGPHEGAIDEGYLHGRGAADHKGALAAMIYGGAILKHLGVALKGDYMVASVVHQNTRAGIGMRTLADKTLTERGWHADVVVLGNPTNLDVYLGHRGRVELEVVTIGRTAHAGAPWLGLNAVYQMVPVLEGLQDLATTLPSHPFLEKSTLAVTAIETAPGEPNTVPDRCMISLDRRFLPSETIDEVIWQVQSVVNRLAASEPEFIAEVRVRQSEETTHTGMRQVAPKLLHPFVTEAGHALVQDAVAALEGLGQSPRFGKWSFATDGGYTGTIKKLLTIGYAPGDEKFAQTPFDRVSLDQVVNAAAGYAAISSRISG